MSVLIKGMEMPSNCDDCYVGIDCPYDESQDGYKMIGGRPRKCPLVPVPPHGRLKKRVVYRGEVYNALESARINALDGILTDRYKDGFHDGLKKALEILANEVQDAPTIIEAEEGEA